jgi:hypothetical protein
MMPSFRPIQTAPRDAVAAGHKPCGIHFELRRKPPPARGGNLQPLALAGHHQTALLQRLRKLHPEFSHQMIIASAGMPQRFGCRRRGTTAARLHGEQRQALEGAGDLRSRQR